MSGYSEYREVNLPWLKVVPAHWEMQRNKNIFTEQKEIVGERSADYTLLSLTLNGIIPRDMDGGGKFPESFDKYKIVKNGDMAFCLFDIDETPRTVGLSGYDGMLTGAYTIMRVSNINARFIYYYYLTLDNSKMLRPLYTGLRKTININTLGNLYDTLKEKLPDVLDVHSWHEFIKAIMNAGYLSGDLILSGNAIFYTYALYLIAKHRFNASYNENMHLTSLWFFYASLVSLYTGSFESTVENHLNSIKELKTLEEYKEFILSRVNERLTNDYFDITLVGSEGLAVSGRGNNAWNAYVASLNIMNAKILFSKSNLLVSKLFEPGTDGNRKSLEKHHLFPKVYLKSQGYSDAKINQMANYAFIDWKDNMDILDDAPSVYYPIVCAGMSNEQIRVMEEENALPHGWENMPYEDFLIERRKLMATKIKAAFEILKKAVA